LIYIVTTELIKTIYKSEISVMRQNFSFLRGGVLGVLLFLLQSVSTLNAQAPLLGFGNQMLSFDENTGIVNNTELPVPDIIAGYEDYYFYDGSPAELHQHVQFDDQGGLLFFIVDGVIYNRDGYAIVLNAFIDDEDEWPSFGFVIDFAVGTMPGRCDQFFLNFSRKRYNDTYVDEIFFFDLSVPSTLWESNLNIFGGLLVPDEYSGEIHDQSIYRYVNNDLIEYDPFYWEDSPGDLTVQELNHNENETGLELNIDIQNKWGPSNYEVVHSPDDQTVALFFVDDVQLKCLSFSSTGLGNFQSHAYWFDGLLTGSSRSYFGDLEVFYNTTDDSFIVALTESHEYGGDVVPKLHFFQLSSNFDLITTNIVELSYIIGDFELTRIYGLEFSQDGNYVYYSKDNPIEVGAVSTEDFSVQDLTSEMANIDQYYRSKIESAYNDQGELAIYFSAADGLGRLNNINDPMNISWESDIPLPNTYNASLLLHPFNNGQLFFGIQQQPTGIETVVQKIESNLCCLEMQNITANQFTSINDATDGVWSYGNNPFGDATAPVRMVEDLVFESGTYTVINNMTFEFDEDADVIIEPGARVRMQNSTFTAITCDVIMWPGVDLLGTTNANNSIDQLPLTGADQGYLEMLNSTIEHAVTGVQVGTNPNNAGGVIRARFSTFHNNKWDVRFNRFHYINTDGDYETNLSNFRNCDFITTGPLNNPAYFFPQHVVLIDVDGVRFKDCSFRRTNQWNVNYLDRGMGILSIRSSFEVEGQNQEWDFGPVDDEHTTFANLTYGIYSLGFYSPLAFFRCGEMEFQQCLNGIVNKNTNNVKIYWNNFELPDAPGFNADLPEGEYFESPWMLVPTLRERGIYITESTGYFIEENTFKGFDSFFVNDEYPCAVGIWVDESGADNNLIRKNSFEEMFAGIIVTSVNQWSNQLNIQGLQLLCNDFEGGTTDIYRASNSTLRNDQGGPQGGPLTPTIPTFNRFSQGEHDCSGYSDFIAAPENEGALDYYTFVVNPIPDLYVDCYSADLQGAGLLFNTEGDWISDPTYDNVCVSDVNRNVFEVNGDLQQLVEDHATVKQALINARMMYQSTVDDNKKTSTLDLLESVYLNESAYVRDVLNQRYPLSKDVLKKLIQKANEMDPWHVTQILLENSPLDKEIMNSLEQGNILSNFFMSFLYNYQEGISTRKLMEMEMASRSMELSRLEQEINLISLTPHETWNDEDTTALVFSPELHLNRLLEKDDLQSRKTSLAAAYLYGVEPSNQRDELEHFQEVYEDLLAVSFDLSLLDSTAQGRIRLLAGDQQSAAQSFHYGIMQLMDGFFVEPDPEIPIQYRGFQPMNKEDKRAEEAMIGVWPNPATDVAWIHYPKEADNLGTIQVHDNQGRSIAAHELKSNGLLELNVAGFTPGVYHIVILLEGEVIDSCKLVVQ